MATKEHPLSGGDVVGTTVNIPLASVKPNPWNPNVMTKEVRESLKHGLQTDGWLASQALLVWASDEEGEAKMVIIDGEHRWTLATELGFKKGPAVLLTGVSEAKAKSLTVALNHRRGESDEAKLKDLLASITDDFGESLGLDTGVSQDELMKLLAVDPVDLEGATLPTDHDHLPVIPEGPGGRGNPETPMPNSAATVRMVQLFLDASNIEEFNEKVAALGAAYGTKTVTDTVLAAVRSAHEHDITGTDEE